MSGETGKPRKGKVHNRGRNKARGSMGAISISSVAMSSKGRGFEFGRTPKESWITHQGDIGWGVGK